MKKVWNFGIACVVVVLFGLLFSGCPSPFEKYQETIIRGIVTLSRNGIPLNPDDFGEQQFGNRHLPNIVAYRTPPRFLGLFQGDSPLGTWGETFPIGSSMHGSNLVSWLGDGRYQWAMRIPDGVLPGVIYFDIFTQISGVQHPWGVFAICEGIRVEGVDSIIELGHFNFNVVQLSGKLPVTINGNPVDNARMEIFLENGIHLCSAEITADGQWSQYVIVSGVETALKFRVEAVKNGGFFRKDLRPNAVHTIYNTDRDFIFPEYPNIDFSAVTLSGTVRIQDTNNRQPLVSNMVFFRDGFNNNTPFSRNFNTLGYAEIRYLHPFGDGSAVWTVMVQEFSFPKRLHFMVSATGEGIGMSNDFSIDITDSTDLSNINLGNIF